MPADVLYHTEPDYRTEMSTGSHARLDADTLGHAMVKPGDGTRRTRSAGSSLSRRLSCGHLREWSRPSGGADTHRLDHAGDSRQSGRPASNPAQTARPRVKTHPGGNVDQG